jgi:hypothetical protein
MHWQLVGYLSSQNSPLLQQADRLIAEGVEHGIDPRVFLAIANAESSLFKNAAARSFNNPFGILAAPNYNTKVRFSSVSAAIDAVGATVASAIRRGADTIAELYAGTPNFSYCVGDCADGLRNANEAMTTLGANPNDFNLPRSVLGIDCIWRGRQ